MEDSSLIFSCWFLAQRDWKAKENMGGDAVKGSYLDFPQV